MRAAAAMRPSTSTTALPEIGRNGGSGRQLRSSASAAGIRDAYGGGGRLDFSASAPSLRLQAGQIRDGVEKVVAKLTERPGIAPLLLLHDAEHGAAVFKAIRNERRAKSSTTAGPQPPRLLTQPPIKKGALNSLQKRSNVLTQVTDELGAFHTNALFNAAEMEMLSQVCACTLPHAFSPACACTKKNPHTSL